MFAECYTIEEEIDGEAFVLMSADDIVSMVKSRGAQLKIAEKKRQLSLNYPALETKVSFLLKVHMGVFHCMIV